MRKFLAALVAVVLFLLVSPVFLDAAPTKKKMPDLQDAIPYPEISRMCGEIEIIVYRYDRLDTQSAPGYKYIVALLAGETVPFLVYIDDNPYDPDAPFTIYVDYDRDGYVDYQGRKGDTGLPESACAVAKKAKATPRVKRA